MDGYYFFYILGLGFATGLKIWKPSTNMGNPANWDIFPTSTKCHKISLDVTSDLTMLWDLPNIFATELAIPTDGNVLFGQDVWINFVDETKCKEVNSATYVRDEFKNWLDPDNWISDTESWVPHVERIPCAGEDISFFPGRSFGVELPYVFLPIGKITFEGQEYDGAEWAKNILSTHLGFEYFRDPIIYTPLRLPWRNDVGCAREKDCFCARSPYKMTFDYKDVLPEMLEQEVCDFARKKCESPRCMFPVIPDGHCCGICGAIIKLQDNTKYGIDLNVIRKKVNQEVKNSDQGGITTYVGRTSDEHIQIVFIADNPDDTIKILSLANLVEEKLKGINLQATLSAKYSGLSVSTYIFKGGLGIAIGTLLAVIALFAAIYYVYIILPKKRFVDFLHGKQFIFARFENTMNEASSEENLEIATASEALNENNQAFDNPMYSGESKPTKTEPPPDFNQPPKTQEEYTNPVYDEFEKSELNIFENKENPTENVESEDDKLNIFSEIEI